jgi:hypothetical protein
MQKMLLLFVLLVIFSSCAKQDESVGLIFDDLIIEYNFESGLQSWEGDFTDYPLALASDSLRFKYELAKLPDYLNQKQNALKFSFDNPNADIFAFATCVYDGLPANRLYLVSFQAEIATKYAGDAGNAIFMKAGATSYKPVKTLYGNFYGINLLKGNHGEAGQQTALLGRAVAPLNTGKFQTVNLKTETPIIMSSDNAGKMWLTVGFDSAFPAATELYISKIRVFFRPA